MKRPISTMALFFAFGSLVFAQNQAEIAADESAIKRIVEEFYLEVIFGNKDITELEKGFHPDFNMYVLYQNQIDKRSLQKWMDRLKSVRAGNASAKNPHFTHNFKLIDITGPTGVVKLEIYADGKLKYTDYLTLYKFQEGWRIMTKMFTQH